MAKGYGQSYNKKAKSGSKKASDGRVTTKKMGIDPNPKGRTVPMGNGPKSHGKKKGY